MTIEEFLRTLLDEEEMKLFCVEPASTFNLEKYVVLENE